MDVIDPIITLSIGDAIAQTQIAPDLAIFRYALYEVGVNILDNAKLEMFSCCV